MLTREAIDRELAKHRDRLLNCGALLECGNPPGLDVIVRMHMEDAAFLALEVADDRRPEVEYLIDRYGALLKIVTK